MANEELTAEAERAVLVGQVREFLSWLGEGRKLTQKGHIRLADARELIGLLGTGDTMDPVIGGKVFKTVSSAELAGLMLVTEWAKAARLTRVTGGKLVPVRKYAGLAGKPLDLVLKLLDAYPDIGKLPSVFPRGYYRRSHVGDEFDVVGPALVHMLLRTPGPCPLAELNDLTHALISSMYMLESLTPAQLDNLRGLFETDTRIAMEHLAALGIVDLRRNCDAPGPHGIPDWSRGTAELTALGRHAVRQVRGVPKPGDPILRLRITLRYVEDPDVWRLVFVPANYTLDRIHLVIQEAMGWTDSHLHSFRIDGRYYGPADFDDTGDMLDEQRFRLDELVKPGDVIRYEYDFGDGWEHDVAVESVVAAVAHVVYPACVDGDGACPPEDSGGVPGFGELKKVLAGPASSERDQMRAWAGPDYDPGRFDLAAANAAVSAV